MGDGAKDFDWIILKSGVHFTQRVKTVKPEGNLVDHVERQIRRAARGKNQLVVFAGIACHENNFTIRTRPAVADGKSQKACVEIDHLVDVGNVKADVAEPQLAFEIHLSSCWMAAVCRRLSCMYYSGTRLE